MSKLRLKMKIIVKIGDRRVKMEEAKQVIRVGKRGVKKGLQRQDRKVEECGKETREW